MEKQDLSKLLIKDSEYYDSNCAYNGVLKKKGITTIDQLLNDDVVASIMSQCQRNTRLQLLGFISMLKYKYANEPLCNEALLDKEIMFISDMSNALVLRNGTQRINVDIMNLLGCPRGTSHIILGEFYRIKNNPQLCKVAFPNDNFKLIDFLKWILTIDKTYFKKVHPFINTYIEAHEKINVEDMNDELVNSLKFELQNLLQKKEKLDLQIQNKKKTLSEIELNGGFKK